MTEFERYCFLVNECSSRGLNESQINEELADKAPKYKDIKAWYADLQKHIAADPAGTRQKMKEKIELVREMRDKLKDEMEDPSGWERFKYTLKALIPFNGLYRFFKMNDNMAGLAFLSNAMFPVVGDMAMRAVTYKAMIANMLLNTEKCLEFLEKKSKELK